MKPLLASMVLLLVLTASAQAPIHRLTAEEEIYYKAADARYEARTSARKAIQVQLKLALAMESAAKQERDQLLQSYMAVRRLESRRVRFDPASLAFVEKRQK